jgi:hypothetical protein
MNRNSNHAICLTLSILTVSPVVAQLDADLLITASANNSSQLVTGIEDDATGDLTLPVRVFAIRVRPSSGFDQLDGDRGFFAVGDAGLLPPEYVPMQPLVDLRFDFRAITLSGASANFWYWDPAEHPDQVSFAPVQDGRTFTFSKTPSSFFHATVDGSPSDVAGFVIDRTGTGGQLHKHLTIVLDDADDDLGTPIRPGVYLVTYALSYPGAESELVYEVIDGNMEGGDALIDQAVEYLNNSLNGPPCPGDLDGDGTVALSDLSLLLSNFGTPNGALPADGDLDGDGDVDLADLAALLSAFGSSC